MNRLFLCLLFFFPLILSAQAPVLTFDEFYQEGGIYPYRAFYDTSNVKQIKGSAAIWDFSKFDRNEPYGIYALGQTVWNRTASEVPTNNFKAAANFFLSTRPWSDTVEPSRYDYLKVVKDTIFQIGSSQEFWQKEGQFGFHLDTIHRENLQPVPIFINDFQYGTIWKDSFIVTYNLDRADSLRKVKSIFILAYEGYGKILLHNGDTIPNAIKLKRVNNSITTYRKMDKDSVVQRQKTSYLWYAKGYAGEIISSSENSILLNYPFYFKESKSIINASLATCSGMIEVELPTVEIVNHCQITGEELNFRIDLYADGGIDSVGEGANAFNYSFPIGKHQYIINAKNECGGTIFKEVEINVGLKEGIEVICNENIHKALSFQMDSTYTVTITAKELDDGSFFECAPSDSLTFRLFNNKLVNDFQPDIRNTANELLEFLPEQLTFDCNYLQQDYLFLFAIHESGSWDACKAKVNLIDSIDYCLNNADWAKICVTQSDGTPVSKVIIDWSYGTSLVTEVVYEKTCIYTRPDVNKTINLMKVDETNLGVSTLDLLLIRKHILGTALFENEAQLLAADVNNTGTITVKDLLDLQKFILGKTNFFPGNTSWRFFPKHWLEEGFDWKSLKIGHNLRFDPKIFEGRRYEFTAVKVGDVSSIPWH